MLHALTLLLFCQLLGEVLARWAGLPIPGPVLGMLLLLVLLILRPGIEPHIRPTLQQFLTHLSLLFVPAGVGVVNYLDRLGPDGPALMVALVGSTLITLMVTVGVFIGVDRLTHGPGASSKDTP